MASIQAQERVSVPRPLSVQTSYSPASPESSDKPPKPAEFTNDSEWLTRGRIGDALVAAARRQTGPVKGEVLLASARLTAHVPPPVLVEELAVLVNAGRLLLDDLPHPSGPLFGRIRLYSAPREADR